MGDAPDIALVLPGGLTVLFVLFDPLNLGLSLQNILN